MNVLIFEDEPKAAVRLTSLLAEVAPEARVVDVIDSIEEGVLYLREQPAPDLLLLDVHLADGPSFELFKEVEIDLPVIFITAYDEYAIKAFKVNSLDYLLKPLKREELAAAIAKYRRWREQAGGASPAVDYRKLAEAMQPGHQLRLLIRFGQQLKALELAEAAYFYIDSRVVLVRTFEGRNFPVDHHLEQLEEILDPGQFFRINRKFIVNYAAIDQMHTYSKSRVKLLLKPPAKQETIVSADRSPVFKEWLLGKG